MLKATKELIKISKNASEYDLFEYKTVLSKLIAKHGSSEDSQVLLKLFLTKKYEYLIDPIIFTADDSVKDILYKKCILKNKELKDQYPTAVLEALSYLGHTDTELVLFKYFKLLFDSFRSSHYNNFNHNSFDLNRSVCLSLLNYSCESFKDLILSEIERCFNEDFFPEFITCLSVKTDQIYLREKLYEFGNTNLSNTFIAGSILGIAMYGNDSKNMIKEIIFNDRWQATYSENIQYTFMAINYLKIGFIELLEYILVDHEKDKNIFISKLEKYLILLDYKINGSGLFRIKFIKENNESVVDLYNYLFNNPVFDSIANLIESNENKEILEKVYFLEKQLKLKMEDEIKLSLVFN